VPDENAVLAVLLDFVDAAPHGPDGLPLDRADAIEVLRREGSALAGLDERGIAAMVNVFANNTKLMAHPDPGIFRGEMQFFSARSEPDMEPAVEGWRPYVTGQITNYRIDCAHKDMLRPAPLAEIGRALEKLLRSPAASRERHDQDVIHDGKARRP
jgi:nonribosomal peptide synthetase DhbF